MNVTEAIEMLKNKGYKITDKREQMLNIFADHNKYLTAREVLSEMQGDFPQLSFDSNSLHLRNQTLRIKVGRCSKILKT